MVRIMNRTAVNHTSAGSVIKEKNQPRVRASPGQRSTRSFLAGTPAAPVRTPMGDAAPSRVNNSRLRGPTAAGHIRPAMPFRQRILLGNCEPSLTALFEAILGRHPAHPDFTVATTLSQLLQHATRTQFDAAIVIVDNLPVPTNAPAERIDGSWPRYPNSRSLAPFR
jgi:hypothetical protein